MVIWSDETKLNLFGSDGVAWRQKRKGDSLKDGRVKKTIKGNGSNIMLWGCINAWGVGNLVRIEGIMDSLEYIKIFQQNLFTSAHL